MVDLLRDTVFGFSDTAEKTLEVRSTTGTLGLRNS